VAPPPTIHFFQLFFSIVAFPKRARQNKAKLGLVGPLGFAPSPQWQRIATSADFYAATFSFFEKVVKMGFDLQPEWRHLPCTLPFFRTLSRLKAISDETMKKLFFLTSNNYNGLD